MLQSFREYFFKRSIKILQDFLCQSCLTISIPHFCLYNTYMGVFKNCIDPFIHLLDFLAPSLQTQFQNFPLKENLNSSFQVLNRAL